MIPELLLKIGDQQTASGLGFEDGDVICAFNRRRIRQVHAEGICHVRRAPRNGSGLIRLDAVIRDWYESTHQYRNERVSRTEVLRTEIATGTQEVFSDKPNKKGERIDVPLYVALRRMHREHVLFGEEGHEIWYGGRLDCSHDALDKVWAAIEAKTENRESEPRFQSLWSSPQKYRDKLLVPVIDFSDEEAAALTAPWTEEETDAKTGELTTVTRKTHNVRADWHATEVLSRLGTTEKQMLDRTFTLPRRMDLEPFSDVLLLWNKKEARPARRLS